MSELETIVATAIATIIGGVVLFVVGQLIQRFFVEPIHEQRKMIGEIACALVYDAPWYTNPGTGSLLERERVSNSFRDKAGRLLAAVNAVSLYWLYRAISWYAPPRDDVLRALSQLIFLSNSIHEGRREENLEARETIAKLLRIRAYLSLLEQGGPRRRAPAARGAADDMFP